MDHDPWSVKVSIAIYRVLLLVYPTEFLRQYGKPMLQVFRDDCLRALRRRGLLGLLALWGKISYDLLTTSIEEHMDREIEKHGREAGEGQKYQLNRREFLNFAWLASLGFLAVDLGGLTLLYSMPRFGEGEFGGRFVLGRAGDVLPSPGSEPLNFPKGKFWLARTADNEVVAPYKVCPHLGCLYNWNTAGGRFICPCHYSQYDQDGTYLQGPAPRSVDRFIIRLLDGNGEEVAATDPEGNPLPLPSEELQVVVDTAQLIRGKPKGVPYTDQAVVIS